ncbi:cGMP-dependent protein kinase 1 isoform X2 [Hermetia illucens]|uniref:cGMP-dependent protein kinase 1 isoform X2 n=1 Tax=Hermetia illucens TaxID=343691 RepID=UPI0018CC2212|nr:cGMP-dependent protein kinase 1 isoform X2 [Hermetia illucens]
MACIRKFFLKDHGSWTPASIEPGLSNERARRYTVIDFENVRPKFADSSTNGNIKTLKFQSLNEAGVAKVSKVKQLDRDSGVHVGENGLNNNNNNDDAETERTSSTRESTDLIPPSRVQGRRKEGLIFTRPKISKEREKIIKVFEKDEKTRNLLRSAIEANEFLNNYMNNECKELVIDAMEPAVYEKDSFIIRENEEGSEIYVSDEGVFDVIKNNEIINTFGAGNVFGELAILYTAKRAASIKASSQAKVWKIERTKFRTIMVNLGSREREENLNFLRSVPLLKDLPEEILLRVVDLLKRVFFPTNTCIVRQGNVGNDFFIIRGGSVTIKKNVEGGGERVVGRRKRGEYFGEQALLNEDRRMASVYADAPGAECLKLDRVSFISYLGTIPELKERPIDRHVPSEERRASNISNIYSHIQLHELERVAVLGVGGFGRVDLVSYKGTQTFALKVLRKIDIIKQEQIDHVYSEKMVMQMCHSPFIVELYTTFRDNKCVYFLMEACLGGDVWTIMHQRQYFDERTAKFIVACVVEAFEFLHERNIIYRDLKPENLMLTPDGYCKLVDFGFAKRIAPNGKTNTFAGTPVYVAPEIILDRGHDRAVDYWELGILIHELLTGRPPFRGRDEMKIYQQILGGIEVVKMSAKIPKPAQNLIKNLCKQMPAERLGYQKRGIMDIKRHSWFDGFDWHKLQNKTMPAPIKRPIRNNTDLRYFTPNDEALDSPPDELSGWDKDF